MHQAARAFVARPYAAFLGRASGTDDYSGAVQRASIIAGCELSLGCQPVLAKEAGVAKLQRTPQDRMTLHEGQTPVTKRIGTFQANHVSGQRLLH
jgi:hypothetical protein